MQFHRSEPTVGNLDLLLDGLAYVPILFHSADELD